MDETTLTRMGLSADWESTAEGRAEACARALAVLAMEPNDVGATDLLLSAAAYILPYTRLRETAQQLLTAEPSSVAGAVLACRAAYQLGGLDEAAALLRANVATHPEHAGGWLRLAAHLMLSGGAEDLVEAQAAIDRACNLAPDDPGCVLARARMMIQRKARADGIALLRQLGARDPLAADLDLARALYLSRKHAEADRVLDGFLAVVPDSPVGLMLRALIRLALGKSQEAVAAAAAALDSAGPGFDPYMTYGLVSLKVGASEAAAASFEYQTQLRPDSAYAWTCLSFARRKTHDTDGARRARYEARARMSERGVKARFALGLSLLALGLQISTGKILYRVLAAVWLLLSVGLLALVVSGVLWLAEGRWIAGALGVSPLIILMMLLLRRPAPAPVRPRRRGAVVLAGSVGATIVHAVAVGLGVLPSASLENAFLALYFWIGTTGLILLILPRLKPQTGPVADSVESRSMKEAIRQGQLDPSARAALGAVSLLVGIPGVLCGGMFFGVTILGVIIAQGETDLARAAGDTAYSIGAMLRMGAATVAFVALLIAGIAALVDRHEDMSYRKKLLMLWCFGVAIAVFLEAVIASAFWPAG